MDTRPRSQLESELNVFSAILQKIYKADLWQRTNFRNEKEYDQLQPIVNLVNVDFKTAGDDSYHLGNMHQRPILPLVKPYVKKDGPGECNSDKQKYVTSSLLLKIKTEEAEDDKTQLAGYSNNNGILQLVSKPEPYIESPDGKMTFELPNFKSEIKLSEELILDDFEGDSEGIHRETSHGNLHERLNPVVVLERFDLHVAGSRSNASEATPSSQFMDAFLQVKTEMDLSSYHACHHDKVKDNPEIYSLPMNHQKPFGDKAQHFSNGKSRGRFVSNKDEKLLHHISANSICDLCDQTFARGSCSTDIVELQTEYQPPSKDRPYLNDNFSGGLKSRAISERHKTEIEISNRISSFDQCVKEFKSKAPLLSHAVHIHSIDQPYACGQCSRKFKRKDNLKKHMLFVHSHDRPFSCGQYSEKFETKNSLRKHVNRVQCDDRPFSCSHCARKFQSKGDGWWGHVGCVVSINRPYSCKQCSEKFKTMDLLKMHISCVHCEDRPFWCDHCVSSFKSNAQLQSHERYVHNVDRPYGCGKCSGKFKTKGHLQTHLVTVHSADRPYSCRQCSGTYKTKGSLKEHITLVHCDDRPFSCCQCSRNFKTKGSLKEHVNQVHCDYRPHSCRQCSRKFKRKDTLERHMFVHSDDRPFSCCQCSRTFKTKSSLKVHVTQVHCDDRPFSCCQCSRNFKQKASLERHMFVHSYNRPYSCDQCSKKYKRRSDLLYHVRYFHSHD